MRNYNTPEPVAIAAKGGQRLFAIILQGRKDAVHDHLLACTIMQASCTPTMNLQLMISTSMHVLGREMSMRRLMLLTQTILACQ